MGMIMRNGKPLSGSSNNADNIKYDNSQSGISAENAQEAIDNLAGRRDWKFGEVVGTLPSTVGVWSQLGSLDVVQSRVYFAETVIEDSNNVYYINTGIKMHFKYNNVFVLIDDSAFAGDTCRVRYLYL